MSIEPVRHQSGRLHLRPAALAMAARVVTALVGGYAAAAALATLAARLLPIDRAEATGWAMILSFLVYAGLALWCFHERRLARAALAVWGSALAAGGALYLLGVRP
jgi:cytochrome bd-type quinol oxidase subunit 2